VWVGGGGFWGGGKRERLARRTMAAEQCCSHHSFINSMARMREGREKKEEGENLTGRKGA